MPPKTPCDEAAVALEYEAGVAVAEIRKHHGISSPRVYGIIKDYGLQRRHKSKNRGEKCECGHCHEKFYGYCIDGQYCTRLCPTCWQMFGRGRRAYAADLAEEQQGDEE